MSENDLFGAADAPESMTRPLAVRMRPRTLDEVIGQTQVLGQGSPLRRLANPASKGSLTAPSSVILFGPPGVGKTTLATIVAGQSGRVFEELSAVTSGVKDVRDVLTRAHERLVSRGQETVLFIDEVHRYSKSQQDALLPAVENRDVTFIGATTENPSFSIIKPLLSRSVVVKLESLEPDQLIELVQRALTDDRGLRGEVKATDEAIADIVRMAGGDARKSLTILEAAAGAVTGDEARKKGARRPIITPEIVATVMDTATVRYDKDGDDHYDVISAFIKSMRGSDPDAAIHYLARMLKAGEDPRFIARRIMIAASEEVGMAAPQILQVTVAAAQAVALVGMPEARIILAEATIAVATAPKSNASYNAINQALADVDAGKIGAVPLYLRNAPTKLMKEWGNHEGYKYAHDWPGAVALTVILTLAVAIVFSGVSMVSVRASLLTQITSQSRADYSNMVQQAQTSLDAADVSATVQIQQLVNDLASSLQSEGPSNLIGVYLWSRDTNSRAIIPVSTEPSYQSLISDDIRSSVASDLDDSVFYQPVEIPGDSGMPGSGTPAAVLGTVLDFGVAGNLEFFAIYSYTFQQQSLTQIQLSLVVICALLSIVVGVVIWLVIRGIVRPIERVAAASETLASGNLDMRVTVDRKDELGVLQQSFNTMADALNQKIDELEEASVFQKRFVSDVSHELRTPVTTMRMASDLLEMKKDGFDPSTKRTVELLAGQISRFQDMLADLLEISRYDAGYAALDLVETDLCEPIETAVDQVDGIAQAKRVPIHTYLPNVQVLTRIDSRRVIRIVRNLLANAVDFAEDRPIEVRVAANRKAVAISVRDYGVGIDEDKVAHVFDRFWRGDLSRSRVTGGTGLGLAIAMTDALLHHGSIRVRSAVGEGTWFLVLLPRDPDQGEVADAELPVNFASETPDDLRVTGGFGVATSQVTHDYHEVRRDTMMGRPL